VGKEKKKIRGVFQSARVRYLIFVFIIKAIAGGAGGGLGNRSRDEFVQVPR
jgi:hypothetical protein